MKHIVAHDLSFALAKRALEKAFESYAQRYARYEPKVQWSSERHADISFNLKGMALSGSADIEDKGIAFDLKVPLVLSMFKGAAIRHLEEEAQGWIAKARSGELG